MTSLSIRQYVLGLYKQLGLREKDVTKVQTGGPGMSFDPVPPFLWLIMDMCSLDGDLGSSACLFWNMVRETLTILSLDEILLSSDKTVAVIDGSGVLADPVGIDRAELVRLAKLRVPVSNFNTAKLSKDGYLVKVEDQDLKLPCGFFLISPSFLCLPDNLMPSSW